MNYHNLMKLVEKKRNVIAPEDKVLSKVKNKAEGGVPLVGKPQHLKVKGKRLAAAAGADEAGVTAAIAARRERKEGAGKAKMSSMLTPRGTPEQQIKRRALKGAAIEARRAKEKTMNASFDYADFPNLSKLIEDNDANYFAQCICEALEDSGYEVTNEIYDIIGDSYFNLNESSSDEDVVNNIVEHLEAAGYEID